MRFWLGVGLALFLFPAVAAGAIGVGLSPLSAGIAGASLAAAIASLLSRHLYLATGFAFATRRWLAIVAAIATVAAAAQILPLTLFMVDSNRVEFSMKPGDSFRTRHSCMSSYAEGARFASEGSSNIYDVALYKPRHIGTLQVDPYHYPPPFLLLPQGLRVFAPEFTPFRALWFAMQLLLLVGAFVAASIWISGVAGATVLAGGALVLALPGTLFSLQQGNFQVSATPLAVLGFALLLAGRLGSGATILAWAAAAKIFPGILVVHLLAARKWTAIAWLAGMGIALLALTLVVQGTRPVRDFVTHAMPEIANASAFPQTEVRASGSVNWSVYGLTVRLRHLGMDSMTKPVGLAIASTYGFLVIALAAFAGWRRPFRIDTPSGRLTVLQVAVALVGLAAFRSPFAGAHYGAVSTVCLLALLAAGTSTYRDARLWMIGMVVYGLTVWSIPSPTAPASGRWLVITGALLVFALALNVWVAVRAATRSTPPELVGEGATYTVPRRGAPAASAAPL